MRETFIGVFGVIVLIVSALSFALMRLSLGDISNKGEAQRAVTSAVAQLQVEGLRIERWLSSYAATEAVREPFEAASARGRGESATNTANAIERAAKNADAFARLRLTLVVLFDEKGVVIGRNGSSLMRGDKLGERYPEMLETVLSGATGSSVWYSTQPPEQLLASYAPVRNAEGKVIGGIGIGTGFTNERLQSAGEVAGKSALFAVVAGADGMDVIARNSATSEAMLSGIDSARQALDGDQTVSLGGLASDFEGAAKKMTGFGDTKAAIVAVTPSNGIGGFRSLIWGMLGAFSIGMILTAVSAHMLDQYISRPIEDVEEALLAIMNGQTDIRVELDHKVFGGLVFRLNSLLNQLLGVQEDDTDDEGRPSQAPSASAFDAALNVDERMVSLSLDEVEDATRLRDEAPEDYYKRIYDEYRQAKRDVGEPVDHVKFAVFSRRIKASELQLSQRHGKPFRYRIEARGKEVVLVAVPLA